MSIKSGRLGQILYDPAGITPVALISQNAFKLDLKTGKIKVTCFGDTNEVYVPGMKDISGTFSGFYNSDSLVLFHAADAQVPGLLKLVPNSGEEDDENEFFWSGKAWLDASIDVKVDGAPGITGSFMAAGPWALDEAA